MDTQHLSYFRVQYFKCFEDIELKDIKQINCILGKNGIGKSSLLEALLFDINADTFGKNLLSVLYKYRRFNKLKNSYWLYYTHGLSSEQMPMFQWCYQNTEQDPYKYWLQIRKKQDEWEQKYDYGIREEHQGAFFGLKEGRGTKKFPNELDISFYKPPFVAYAFLYGHELTDTYTRFIQTNRKAKYALIEAMRVVMPSLLDLEISTLQTEYPALIVWQENVSFSVPLAACSDSVMRAFRIFAEIIAHKGKRLMIDDIETSIHPQLLPQFLGKIVEMALEYEVQIFMSSNTWACQQILAKISEEQEWDKIAFFGIEEAENKIFSVSLPHKHFLAELENVQEQN